MLDKFGGWNSFGRTSNFRSGAWLFTQPQKYQLVLKREMLMWILLHYLPQGASKIFFRSVRALSGLTRWFTFIFSSMMSTEMFHSNRCLKPNNDKRVHRCSKIYHYFSYSKRLWQLSHEWNSPALIFLFPLCRIWKITQNMSKAGYNVKYLSAHWITTPSPKHISSLWW